MVKLLKSKKKEANDESYDRNEYSPKGFRIYEQVLPSTIHQQQKKPTPFTNTCEDFYKPEKRQSLANMRSSLKTVHMSRGQKSTKPLFQNKLVKKQQGNQRFKKSLRDEYQYNDVDWSIRKRGMWDF